MATNNKLSKDRNQKVLLEIVSQPGNNVCADCHARTPRWASWNLGIFICVHCASVHRKIGTHVTKVKSLSMDEWTKEQVEVMKNTGNVKSNSIYNPNEIRNPPPPNVEDTERDSEIEQYIRNKYQYKKFLDKSAFVASMLGPSAAPSNVASSSRSVSSPTVARSQTLSKNDLPPPKIPASTSASPRVQPAPAPAQPAYPSSLQSGLQTRMQSRSASQPILAQASNTAPISKGGVWDDISALNSGQNASLPLQYSAPTSAGIPHSSTYPSFPANSASGLVGPLGIGHTGVGMNPYQQSNMGSNPFASQSTQQMQHTSLQTPTIPPSPAAAFFQPQPQNTNPSPGAFMSVPTGTNHNFLTPSPSQQLLSASPHLLTSHSPQLAMHSQPQFGQATPTLPQSQFLGMTTMQMQQQQYMLQQQQQQQLQQQQQQQQQQQLLQQLEQQRQQQQQQQQLQQLEQQRQQQQQQQYQQQQLQQLQAQQYQQQMQQMQQQQQQQQLFQQQQPQAMFNPAQNQMMFNQTNTPLGQNFPQNTYPAQNNAHQWGAL